MSVPIKAGNCPRCGKMLTRTTDPTAQGQQPAPGDMTICLFCSTLLVFTDEMQVRLMLRQEFEKRIEVDPRILTELGRAMLTARLMRIQLDLTSRN